MLRRILGLTLALVLAVSGLAFAGSAGGGTNTTTQTQTQTSTTSTTNVDVGTVNLGYTINGYERDVYHPEWGYNFYGYGVDQYFNYTYSVSRNYSSTLELLSQQPNRWSESGNYWEATHPGEAFVSFGGRGSVICETAPQFMGSDNYALQATSFDGTTVSTTTSTTTTQITDGDFVLGTNTNINTNTNTEYDYTHYTGTGTYSYYQVNAVTAVSPIVLDLSHTGKLDASGGNWLPHKGIKGKLAVFDLRGNGLDMITEWVGPKAGLLVEPRADGTVDGSCLFGTAGGFANGFEKLALRDKNNDGRLTGTELKGLAVWVDSNQNGKIDAAEIHTLASLQITEIGVRQKQMRATFVMNGKTETVWDWWPTALDVRRVAARK